MKLRSRNCQASTFAYGSLHACIFNFLLVALGIIIFTDCRALGTSEQAAAEAEANQFMALLQVVGPLSRTNSYTNVIPPQYTDMEDGTIKREHFLETCDRSGNCTYSNAYPVIYIKKCLYGQVYRPAENDCKGTGNSGNFYGALKVQFCATDDTSCEDAKGYATSASPAYQVCDAYTTAGREWTLPIISAEYHPDRNSEPNLLNSYPDAVFDEDFLQLTDDMPQSSSNSIWHRVQLNGNGTKMYVYEVGNNTTRADVQSRQRTFYSFVLCTSVEESL
ncbi:MAG: hypothetical protein CMN77_20155 [Spirochaetaceae bacterium]|nr:hypothetical protein [Spirochaetaceae bacterium]